MYKSTDKSSECLFKSSS